MGEIEAVGESLIYGFRNGGKLLICGNGGSAADSQHLAAEFVSSFEYGLSRKSLPAISLTVDSSILTAISNDFSFDLVFSRQVEALGVIGDMLLTISTSGKSQNCIQAVEAAKKIGLTTLSLTRQDSPLYDASDLAIGVPSTNTQRIQECHIVAYHILAGLVDSEFMKE
jgi:D-sedoheptulose 7-phosphate isomerase